MRNMERVRPKGSTAKGALGCQQVGVVRLELTQASSRALWIIR